MLSVRRLFSPAQKLLILRRANYQCEICGVCLSRDNFEADHRIAYSQGGATQVWNALALCKNCNRQKSARPYHS
ncbi:HNH endonuclease signature motif containing protein [Chroococcidiopsis cubana]|uniref:HNH endonuclease n=1 Tax=Chroococcidiopsis TaxID=54298 RepID=UPI000F8E4B93